MFRFWTSSLYSFYCTLGSRYTDSPYSQTPKSLTHYTDWPGDKDWRFWAVRITRPECLNGSIPIRTGLPREKCIYYSFNKHELSFPKSGLGLFSPFSPKVIPNFLQIWLIFLAWTWYITRPQCIKKIYGLRSIFQWTNNLCYLRKPTTRELTLSNTTKNHFE